MKRFTRYVLITALLGLMLAPLTVGRGRAADKHVLRIGTLAPKGSSWEKVFRAFHHSLDEKSGGRLGLRIYAGGVAGDERDVIRKMKVGQMDGGALTSVGLGQIVRPVLVLQLPGMFEAPEQLARVRDAMHEDFKAQFDKAGYTFLGWGDVGDLRVFSDRPINEPDDYLKTRPWMWRDDPISPALFQTIGANGVALGLPEVFPALQTGMVDTVMATAVSAVALQWFRHVTHMSKSNGQPVVGATVVRKQVFNALPPDLQEILLETSERAHATLAKRIRKEDAQAAKLLKKRGIKEFDMMAQRDRWEPVLRKVADKLTGRVYSKELLDKVYKMARSGKPGA